VRSHVESEGCNESTKWEYSLEPRVESKWRSMGLLYASIGLQNRVLGKWEKRGREISEVR
jgi:hypothetical protein